MNIREWTLPVYTILTQLAAGALFVLWVIRTLSNSKYGGRRSGSDHQDSDFDHPYYCYCWNNWSAFPLEQAIFVVSGLAQLSLFLVKSRACI